MTDAYSAELDAPFGEAVQRTRAALQSQGFGILTEADLHATFAERLGPDAASELGDYVLLGACNPPLARRALAEDPAIGLLLPCNVLVRRGPGAPVTTVQAVRPADILPTSSSSTLAEVALDADSRLVAAIGSLRSGGTADRP